MALLVAVGVQRSHVQNRTVRRNGRVTLYPSRASRRRCCGHCAPHRGHGHGEPCLSWARRSGSRIREHSVKTSMFSISWLNMILVLSRLGRRREGPSCKPNGAPQETRRSGAPADVIPWRARALHLAALGHKKEALSTIRAAAAWPSRARARGGP